MSARQWVQYFHSCPWQTLLINSSIHFCWAPVLPKVVLPCPLPSRTQSRVASSGDITDVGDPHEEGGCLLREMAGCESIKGCRAPARGTPVHRHQGSSASHFASHGGALGCVTSQRQSLLRVLGMYHHLRLAQPPPSPVRPGSRPNQACSW